MTRALSLVGIILLLSFMGAGTQSTAVRWQLDTLDPSEPSQYFLRAEEVADVADDAPQRRLAIRLYAIAATLDPDQWGTSGLLGIIELLDDESTIRALRSMIELQESDPAGLLPESRVVLGQTDRATVAAFALPTLPVLRSRTASRIPGVRERLLAYQDEIPGGMQRLIDDLMKTTDTGVRQRLTAAEQVAQLQVQLRLLGGREESWSATLMAWRGRPMQSLESHDLGTLLGLDLDRQVWRNDRWQPIEVEPPSEGDQ